MDPGNGVEKMMAEENNMEDGRESEESEETKQFIRAVEERSLREALDIIVTRGFIKTIN